MSLNQSKPQVTSMKRWIIFGAGGLLILALVLILANLIANIFHAAHKDSTAKVEKAPSHIATTQHPEWIEQGQVRKAAPTKVQTMIPDNQSVSAASYPKPDQTVKKSPEEQAAREAYQKAMAAPITSNQLNPGLDSNVEKINPQQASSPAGLMSNGMLTSQDDPNQQAAKKAFLENNSQLNANEYLPTRVTLPKSPYEVKAGTIIPATLIKGINSDLPGQMTAQVRNNVYDTVTGNYLLIPQGTTIIGSYNSEVTYGQERVQVIWKRLIFPNGQSLNILGMPGTDVSGYSGFNDQVNNHYVKIFGSTILMSALAAGAQLSQPQQAQNPFAPPTVGQTLAQSLGTNIANTGNALLAKNLGIQPPLIIRPGFKFNIEVTQDAILPQPYHAQVVYENSH